jgi:hypothetical protein
MIYETKFILSLIVTLIIEIPILFIFIKYFIKPKNISIKKIITVGIIASTLTLPYLWFVLIAYLPANYYLLIGELFVILIESLIYYQLLNLKLHKAFYVSLIANIFSILVGILIF